MVHQRPRLLLFARYPTAGRVKTRLIPALGGEGAAALHRRLVLRTLRTADAFCQAGEADLEIHFDGGPEGGMQHWLGDGWCFRPQGDGDLGERMADAFDDSFGSGAPATVIIGSDCPGLTPGGLASAFGALANHAAVLGPANDGGYYLVGLARPIPELFRGVAWGTGTVLAESLRILEGRGVRPILLESMDDVDRPEDLAGWQGLAGEEAADAGRISVIVPALNEASHIVATLQAAGRPPAHEMILVDGGSTDATVSLARGAGATVLHTAPGRARQMNAGAARATGNILLFVHADTRLPPDWSCAVAATLHRPGVAAGAFRFRIADRFPGRRIVEWTAQLRSRWGQMPYGDQGLFLRRSVFEELGGYADLAIMEDYELVRRLRRRGRIITESAAVLTSGRRWRRLGVWRTTWINRQVVMGYHLGVAPARLAALYRGEPDRGD